VVSRAKVHAHGGHGHVVGTVPKARGVPLQNGMHNGWKMWKLGKNAGWPGGLEGFVGLLEEKYLHIFVLGDDM